ncbi:SDR family oxidoreductase [Sorangium sp. So ce176]|uniref:SDR family oxidoreductase n=1 Tax=Sorangium sp. So ce176 TaxID=3133286 RepID=UPI003F5F046E
MKSYAGKKAVVTGGTHGMGLATVKALLDGGAEVLLTGRNERNREAARRELGRGAHVVRSDAGSLADIDALRAFAQGFAAELLPRRIRVNAVSPGFIKTPTMGVAGASADVLAAFEQEGREVTPMKRIGTPEEVARAALFLAFDATFTTGVELPVDGGLGQGITVPHA